MEGRKIFYSITDKIIAYESGKLTSNEILELFSELVKNGIAWTMQGSYERIAQALIENEYLSKNGDILKTFKEKK